MSGDLTFREGWCYNVIMEDEIIKLTAIWYSIASLDHHKDRDCHWYINKVYSYGRPAIYRVEHYGYIGEQVGEEFPTATEAHEFLITTLKDYIRDEVRWANEVLQEPKKWDEYQVENARKIISIA
jgi:hypothetical protein